MTKYHAIKTIVDGIMFASKREARRYQELKLLQSGKVIRDLELQPTYHITINGIHVCNYIADFRYFDNDRKKEVVEDVKSLPTKTSIYMLKKKLVKAIYGILIEEV